VSTDDILDLIDGAIGDYTSGDAMRWKPDPEPDGFDWTPFDGANGPRWDAVATTYGLAVDQAMTLYGSVPERAPERRHTVEREFAALAATWWNMADDTAMAIVAHLWGVSGDPAIGVPGPRYYEGDLSASITVDLSSVIHEPYAESEPFPEALGEMLGAMLGIHGEVTRTRQGGPPYTWTFSVPYDDPEQPWTPPAPSLTLETHGRAWRLDIDTDDGWRTVHVPVEDIREAFRPLRWPMPGETPLGELFRHEENDRRSRARERVADALSSSLGPGDLTDPISPRARAEAMPPQPLARLMHPWRVR
jgi:hypothetical protein